MSTLSSFNCRQPDGGDRTADALPAVGDRYTDSAGWVEVFARATLPTRHGEFQIIVFHNSFDDKEHLAIVRGHALTGAERLPVRVHSECLTGDVLGSLRCDCREQLERSLEALGKREVGALLYLRQEGRGIGLGNKIRAYTLQEEGLDTFEANQHLGFDDDLRDYRVAAWIIKLLGPASVVLATNNPRKVFGLRAHGVEVASRAPLVTAPNQHNSDYLDTKARAGHLLS